MESCAASCSAAGGGGAAGSLYVNFVNTFLAAQCALVTERSYPADYKPFLSNGDEFDYIVVGAGSAGSIVASRLAENEKMKILLIEAGGYPSATSAVPLLLFALQNTPEDWAFRTEPSNTACLGLKNKQCNWPRGKVLGGSSAINGMLYFRGHRQDYEEWSNKNPNWNYDANQPYFKKIEKLIAKQNPQQHQHQHQNQKHNTKYGKNGKLTLDTIKSKHPIRKLIIEAAKEIGYNYSHYTEIHNGYFDVLNNIENNTRLSSSGAYLTQHKEEHKKTNLFLVLNTHVTRLIFNSDKKTVIGLEISDLKSNFSNKTIKIYAKKEVILSAGSINTPKILMLSGVGPKKHLESKNIALIKDLQGVGENLQDHIMFTGLMLKLNNKNLTFSFDKNEELYKFYAKKPNLFSSLDILNLIGFINTQNISSYHMYPDIQFLHFINLASDVQGLSLFDNSLGFEKSTFLSEADVIKNENKAILRIIPNLVKPKSRGKVLLRSSDPFDSPLLFPNYFSDENDEDVNTLLRGINFVKNLLLKTRVFKQRSRDFDLIRQHLDNCKNIVEDDEFYKCAIRNAATTVYHQVGTCKMGPKEDKEAVVDHKLRVHGINNLRIIDASIMPTITSVNTNGPTMMIGERGADFIKETWT